jgi:PAS domain S-box-containing protein
MERGQGFSAEARRLQDVQFEMLLSAAPDAMVLVDAQGLIVLVNDQTEKIFGYSRDELVGGRVEMLIPEEVRNNHEGHRDSYGENPSKRPMGDRVLSALHKDGSSFSVEISLSPVELEDGMLFCAAIRDVSERLELEERLRQAQKMESIGRLAGGVAHDFNNLLTVIIGYTELMKLKEPPDAVSAELIGIDNATRRATDLTGQLLALSRRQVLRMEVLELNQIIEDNLKMLPRLLGEDIEVNAVLSSRLPLVRADRGQISQVILNLAVNARDAMPKGGKLTIETAAVEGDDELRQTDANPNPGGWVRLRVSDTGLGIDTNTRRHVFEPFFTTKEVGRGTGLGLSTVHGIVEQFGGSITVSSNPGEGTRFSILLPVTLEVETERSVVQQDACGPTGETVLVVEDESLVLEVTSEVLRSRGYRVLEANSPDAALRIAVKHTDEINLLVTDIVMPGMRGPELAQRMSLFRCDFRVLYVSAYPDAHGVPVIMGPDMPFLPKPFTPVELSNKVREVMEGPIMTASINEA